MLKQLSQDITLVCSANDTYKELECQVAVWILILKADRALLLQMNSVNERDRALIPVGLQIASLRHPGRTVQKKSRRLKRRRITYKVFLFLTGYTCCR